MSARPQFLYVTCQVGAEKAVKSQMSRHWPDFHVAFARPGFLTYKLPADCRLRPDFDLGRAIFVRACGFALGGVTGETDQVLAENAWKLFGARRFQRIHVWPRDAAEPGHHGYEPGLTPAAAAACEALREACPRPQNLPSEAEAAQPARPGDWILDCVVLEPSHWWVGYHQAKDIPSRWPGGLMPLSLPPHAVSRAWLKMEEALRWTQWHIPAGARWAEIGSAPGGASQALLDRGYHVLGIDPAEMDAAVLGHARFTHIRRRAPQVPRRAFRKIRWLAADMNVAPRYTLDAVESIVTYPEVHISGLLLTLKLPEWNLAEQTTDYLDRIRGWGFNLVRARQLQHNRREICVAALKKPFNR